MTEEVTVPGSGHCLVWHRGPYGLGGFLLFEPALENVSELLHVKHAHRGAGNAGIEREKRDGGDEGTAGTPPPPGWCF